jgi:vitamin B12 transporter
MISKNLGVFCLLLLCQVICAQEDSIIKLKTVIVTDYQLKNNSQSLLKQELNDSVIKKNQSSLTALLNYNSVLYLKENGLGMISSPSFRGTTAQQTAVIWNGININSQLTGQTDFNTVTTHDFSSITVRAGGGSSIYGTGAIGGSIHLNNDLQFKNQFKNELFFSVGSFNTFGTNVKSSFSDDKKSVVLSVSNNNSQNDYPFLNSNSKNENGQFNNTSFSLSLGYQINKYTIFKIFSQVFDSERFLSPSSGAVSKSKYLDFNARNLFDWTFEKNKIRSSLKWANLSEQYRYFQNYNSATFETSKASTQIIKYDFGYQLNKKMQVEVVYNFSKTNGQGTNISHNALYANTIALFFKHQLFRKLLYEWSIRNEQTNLYKSPFLYSFGTRTQLCRWYSFNVNVSKNYRVPTFNDLFWKGLGNKNLQPEQSLQGEVGHEFAFKTFTIKATTYYNKISNLIRWTPKQGIWRPENLDLVTTYGAEISVNCTKKIKNHSISNQFVGAYTISRDEKLKKQLIYVPFYKLNHNLHYTYKKIEFQFQNMHTGSVYTTSDNLNYLNNYLVSNAGLYYLTNKKYQIKIGLQALNLLNKEYQITENRPMPGRNFNININLTI